jgi:hypothetical protein
MAECVYCGFETRLFERDEPVCVGCAGRLDAGEKLTRKEKPRSEKNPLDEKISSAGA